LPVKASDGEGATEPDEGVPDEPEAAASTGARVVVVAAHTVVLVVVVEEGTVVLVVVVEVVLALAAEAGAVVLVVLVVVVEAGAVILVVVVEEGTVVLVVVVVGAAPVAQGVVLVVVVVEPGTAKVVVVLEVEVVVVESEVEVVEVSTCAVQHGRSPEMQVPELVEAVQFPGSCDVAAVAPASPPAAITREANNSPAPRLNLDSRPGHRRIQRSFHRSVSVPAGAPGSTRTRPRHRTVGPAG